MEGDFTGVAITCAAYGIAIRDPRFIGLGAALFAQRALVIWLRSYGI